MQSDLTPYFVNIEDYKNNYDDNAAAVCASQDLNPESPATLTLDGFAVTDGVATFTVPARISIISAGDLSGITYAITGTDLDGNVLTEEILGPSGDPDTVYTDNFFATVTEIEVIDGTGSEIVGTVGVKEGGATKLFDVGRIRSIYFSPDGSSSNPVFFYKNFTDETIGFAFVPKDNVGGNILFPDTGVRFSSGCYVAWPTDNAFRSLTVMVS
jgi:hypothetical protein